MLRLLPSLFFPFFNDDFVYLDGLRGRGLLDLLAHPMRVGGYLRPFSRELHFRTLWEMFGLHPFPYHLVNLGLVLAAGLLLFRIGRRAIGPRGALLAAALFVLSHVHAVLVAWASCDQDLWALCFALLSALLFLRGMETGATRLSAAAFAFALLSKESAAFLPLPLYCLALPRRGPGGAFRAVLPHLVLLALWALVYGFSRPDASSLRWDTAAMAALPARFLLAAIGIEGPGLWRAFLGSDMGWKLWLAGAACGGALLLQRRGEAPAASALPWIAWAVAGLVPLLPVASDWSGYYLALPLAGACLAIGALTDRLAGAWLAPLPLLLLVSGQATNAETVDSSTETVRGDVSAVSLNRLRVGANIVLRALRDLPAAVPDPEPGSRFIFNGLPRRNGFMTADGPALRLLYNDATLAAMYLGDLTDPSTFRRTLYYFSWMDEQDRFVQARPDPIDFMLEMEVAGRPKTGIAAARHVIASLDSTYWPRWNLGFLLLEAGDSAGAEAEWAHSYVARVRDPGDVRSMLEAAHRAESREQRTQELLQVAFAAPTDSGALMALSRDFAGKGSRLGAILAFRATRLAPGDTSLLKEAAASLRAARATPAAERLEESLARRRAGAP